MSANQPKIPDDDDLIGSKSAVGVDFTIEIDHNHLCRYDGNAKGVSPAGNCKVLWPPTNVELRGKWEKARLRGNPLDDPFSGSPDFPGLMVRVNGRTATIRDPLNEKRLAKTLKALQDVWKPVGNFGPDKDRKYDNLTDSELKNWCYWARRLVDSKFATLISGRLPAMTEIVGDDRDKKKFPGMPGEVTFEIHDQHPDVKHERAAKRYVAPRFDTEDSEVAEEVLL